VGAVTATDAPAPAGTSASGSTSTSTPVALPDDVKGQTAATQTCSKGNN
jgi:hypothetical protein